MAAMYKQTQFAGSRLKCPTRRAGSGLIELVRKLGGDHQNDSGVATPSFKYRHEGALPHHRSEGDAVPDHDLYPAWLDDYERHITIRAYSEATRRSYRHNILAFYHYFSERDVKDLARTDVEKYLEYLCNQKHYSASALNVTVNAIKFLYERVWRFPREFYTFPRAKKPQQLPAFFHPQEITDLFNNVQNLKHTGLLYTAYSAG